MAELQGTSHSAENKPPRASSQWQFVLIGILWIALGAFTLWQLPSASNVIVEWTTETETDNAGFNLYRGSTTGEGEAACASIPADDYIQVNNELIPAQGGAVSGASYAFPDNSAAPDRNYCYVLEDVELTGQTSRHDPFPSSPRQIDRILYIILAPASLIVGTALIISGLRGKRTV